MNKSLICLLTTVTLMFTVVESEAQDNIAYQDDKVRITVVTDGVVRLEWEATGKFTDSPSLVASERDYPATDFKVSKKGKEVRIQTFRMTVSYKMNSGKFTKSNLEIKAADGFFTWKPGMQQKENLKGTFRTLDGLDGDVQTQTWVADIKKGEIRQFEDGILAKDGWTLIDESENFLFDDSEWAWVKEREAKECQDWYFMAYGHDYKAALKDFSNLPEILKKQPRINEEDIEWFLTHCGYNL